MPETPRFIRAQTTERTQTFARPTSDVTQVADAKARLANNLEGFFKPALQQEQENQRQESLFEIRRENEELGQAAINRVLKSPKEAREAIKRGDLSAFAPNEEALSRRAFVDTFKTTAGALGADDAASTSWTERLSELPQDGDPSTLRDQIASEEIGEGADPLFEQSFLERFLAKTEGDIEKWREDRARTNAAVSLTRRQDVFESDLRSGDIEPTLEELHRLYGEFSNAGGLLGAEGRLGAVENFEMSIIREAARENNGVAMKLLNMSNPDRDGLSIADRHPEMVEKAVQESITRFNQVKSLDAHQDLIATRDLLKALRAGSGEVTPGMLLSRMAQHRTNFGFSNAWEETANQVLGALKGQADIQGVFGDISNGRTPLVAQKDWNKASTQVYDNYANQCATQGGDPVSCQAQALTAIARRGTGSELKDRLSAVVIGGTDEQFTQDYQNIDAMMNEVPGVNVSGHILEEDAANMFLGVRALVKGGRSPIEARELVRTAPANISFTNHLSAQNGRGMARNEVDKSIEKTWKQTRQQLEDQGYDVPKKFENLSPELQGLVRSNLNLASWMRHSTNAPISELQAMAAEMTAGRVDLSVEDGEIRPVLRRSPESVILADGSTAHMRRYEEDDLNEAMGYLRENDDAGLVSLRGVIGDTLSGLRSDRLTEQNMGMAVLSNQSGFSEEIELPVGQVYRVPREELEAEEQLTTLQRLAGPLRGAIGPAEEQLGGGEGRSMLGFFGVQDDPDDPDMVVLTVPTEGPPIQVDSGQRVYMVHDGETWRMRYLGQPIITQEMQARDQEIAFQGAERQLESVTEERAAQRAEADETEMRMMEASGLTRRGALSGQTASRSGEEFFPSGYPANYRQMLEDATAQMSATGGLRASTARRNLTNRDINTIEDVRGAVEDMFLEERAQGSLSDNLPSGTSAQWMDNFVEFLTPLEGLSEWAYDDHTGRRVNPGESVQGSATVGIGTNLSHPKAAQWLGRLGLDFDKVRTGQQRISPKQARTLVNLHATDTLGWLRNHFKDNLDQLTNHQFIALTSLAFNSRWNRRGPTLIGPRLTAAIKNGDMEAAAKEIRENSSGGVPKRLKSGIRARRAKEAAMFVGDFLQNPQISRMVGEGALQ